MRQILIVIFFYFGFTFHLLGQGEKFYFKNLDHDTGLPSSEVYCVIQDHLGYIWFSTDRGVCRYNGDKLEVFNESNGLLDNTVFKICVDEKNRIWMVSISGAVFFYSYSTQKIHLYDNSHLFKTDNKTPLLTYSFQVANDTIFLNSNQFRGIITPEGSNLFTHNFKNKLVTSYVNEFPVHFFDKSQTRKLDTILFTTSTQIYDTLILEYPQPKSYENIIDAGNYYILQGHRSFKLIHKKTNDEKEVQMPNHILYLSYQNEKIYVSCYQNGLVIYDLTNLEILHHLLKERSASHSFIDKDNGLWITTLDKGVFHFPSFKVQRAISNDQLDDIRISAINQFQGKLIIGNRKGSLDIIDQDGNIKNYPLKTSKKFPPYVKFIRNYGDTALWVLAGSDLFQWKDGHFVNYPLPNIYCHSFEVLPSGKILVSSSKQIHELSYDSTISHLIPEVRNIQRFDSLLFLSGISGFNIYNPNSKEFIPVPECTDISDKRVISSYAYDGTTVIITRDFGIYSFQDKSQKIINEDAGLLSNSILCSSLKDSILWVATIKGLNRVNILTGKVQSLTKEKGLFQEEIKCLSYDGKVLFMGTNSGLYKLYDDGNFKSSIPNVILNNITINDEPVYLSNDLLLPKDSNRIAFHLDAITLQSKQVKFRYKLNGLDDQWHITESKNVVYTLPKGNYQFIVQVRNGNDNWSPELHSPAITILPAYHETLWFRSSAIGFIVLIVFSGIQWRINTIKKRNAVNQKLIESQLKALRAQMNPHFTFNTMNAISGFISDNSIDDAQEYLAKFSKLIRLILNHSEKDYITVEEELTALKHYIELEKVRFGHQFNYDINIDPRIDIENELIPSLIIQPFIENSIIHGFKQIQYQGKIDVTLIKKVKSITCTIVDNGIGREKANKVKSAKKHKSMGVNITKDRLNLLGKVTSKQIEVIYNDIIINDKIKGTKVTLEIPIINYENINH